MLFAQTQPADARPAGITLIAVVVGVYGCVAASYAALVAFGVISLSSGAWVVEGGLEILGPGIFAAYAVAHFICAAGLWRMQRWALRLTYLLLVYEVIQVTPAISSAVGDGRVLAIVREGAQILWRTAALWYLWQGPTRDAFRSRSV